MALKTTNYKIAETGATLSEAFALVTHIDAINNKATLSIANSRENALKGVCVKKIIINCEFDRNGDIFTQAYESAAKMKKIQVIDENTGLEKEVDSIPYFYGWKDAII